MPLTGGTHAALWAIGKKNLMVCDLHASCDPNEFVSDKGWQQIVDTLKRAGKAFPSRETLRVTFNPL